MLGLKKIKYFLKINDNKHQDRIVYTLQIIDVDVNKFISIRSIMFVFESQGVHQFVNDCFNTHTLTPLKGKILFPFSPPNLTETAVAIDDCDVIWFRRSRNKLNARFILNVPYSSSDYFTIFPIYNFFKIIYTLIFVEFFFVY